MATTFRVGTFNFENLFERPKVLNLKSNDNTADKLEKIAKLQGLLFEKTYTPAVKAQILSLYDELKPYIKIAEDKGKLFGGSASSPTIKAGGRDDWDGTIELKPARITEMARENTAKVVKSIKVDVLCTVEIDNRPALQAFDSQMLANRYPYELLVDGNDPRGIDVGLCSKFPIGEIRTHIFDKDSSNKVIFSRDCLEVELELPNNKSLYILCNHFKSQGYGNPAANDAKRKKQAERVAEILRGYDLSTDYVVVAGDLNDTNGRPPAFTLKPLLGVSNLFDVLELQFPTEPEKRWTYNYRKDFNQIDFLLVSKPLKTAFRSASVERRGIFGLNAKTSKPGSGVPVETEFDSVKSFADAASDHAAVVAEFSI